MTPYTHGLGLELGLPGHGGALRGGRHPPGLGGGHAGVVVADLTRRGGEPVAAVLRARALRRKAIADWEAQELTTPYAGIELEAYLLEPDGEGGFRAHRHPGGLRLRDRDRRSTPMGSIDDIWARLLRSPSSRSSR